MTWRNVILLTFAVCSRTWAQDAKPPEPEAVFRSESTLVELHATVTDAAGKLVTGLPQSAFRVVENGRLQAISVFRQEDAPVSLGILIDNSESMGPRRASVAAAALTLVRASNPEDEVFLINFNDKPNLVCDFTKNPADLEKALGRMDSSGATAMRDALMMGIEHLKRGAKNDKKVLLVVTDGEDNSSVVTQEFLLRSAQQSGVLIYSIGLLADAGTRERARAQRDLDATTLTSGGEVFYPSSLDEVEGIAKHVASDLRNQYTIAYKSTDERQDGAYRKIQVKVAEPEGAVVKTRDGYYAAGPPS